MGRKCCRHARPTNHQAVVALGHDSGGEIGVGLLVNAFRAVRLKVYRRVREAQLLTNEH